ncbi:MAG: hypothetical protein IKU29_01135, partial [Parabacteroides sp.]|nr:hypothetical protein [Parabacteroides sp.]
MSILDVDTLVQNDKFFAEKWIEKNCRIDGTYTIKNNVVNVKGSVFINQDVAIIDVQFGEVKGHFSCYNCQSLTSLQGAPKKVGNWFSCSGCNSLTSLQGAPEEVGNWFSCSGCNSLTSLQGAPEEVGGCFYCSQCSSLTSLQGASKEVVS